MKYQSRKKDVVNATFLDITGEPKKMQITVSCVRCLKTTKIVVDRNRYAAWQEGELIQIALSDLTAAEREMLRSGICDECWGVITNV